MGKTLERVLAGLGTPRDCSSILRGDLLVHFNGGRALAVVNNPELSILCSPGGFPQTMRLCVVHASEAPAPSTFGSETGSSRRTRTAQHVHLGQIKRSNVLRCAHDDTYSLDSTHPARPFGRYCRADASQITRPSARAYPLPLKSTFANTTRTTLHRKKK